MHRSGAKGSGVLGCRGQELRGQGSQVHESRGPGVRSPEFSLRHHPRDVLAGCGCSAEILH